MTIDGPPSAVSKGVLLRPMRWWDVGELMPLEQELFGRSAWSAETFWSELAHPLSRWYVVAALAADPAHLVGYAGLLALDGDADVQTIAVAAQVQGRGVGGALIDALIVQARLRSASSLLLEVRADNASAVGLYTKRGFERIAVRRRYYQPEDVDAWVMRLGLVGDRSPTP
jgi:[ribosomal protein S18]-alanine N-acetyltransferase